MEGRTSPLGRWSCAGLLLLGTAALAAEADCNGNGVEDAEDVLPHGFALQPALVHEYEDPAIFLLAADLSGDGAIDLVAPTVFGERVPVFLNRGDGTFSEPIYYPTGPGSNAAAADLNGDGWLDLATPGAWVLLNQGGGAFADPVRYGPGTWPSYIIIAADFDRDGSQDLGQAADGLQVFRNRGDGTFDEALYPVDRIVFRTVTADFDGANGPDIGAVQDSDFLIFFNRGDGTFDEPSVHAAGVDATFVFEAMDLDANGAPDLVAEHDELSEVVVLFNHGDGTFAPAERYPAGPGIVSLVAADFTGDGRLDIATGNNAAATVGVLVQRSEGGFDAVEEHPARRNTSGVNAADLDLDGDLDIVAGSGGSGTLLVLVNDGSGAFSPLETDVVVGGSIATIAADVDGSGSLDIVVPTVRGVSVIINATEPPASRDVNSNGLPDECEGGFHRGDANGDGPTDISDGIAVLATLFAGREPPRCRDAADANDDGALNVSDAIFIFHYLFTATRLLPHPGAMPAPCGLDPEERGFGQALSLGCEAYDGC
jgi:hypothetical protein